MAVAGKQSEYNPASSPHRLLVRISGFHPEGESSILSGGTKVVRPNLKLGTATLKLLQKVIMNVIDDYKFMILDDIKRDLTAKRADYTSVFINLTHDFNKAVGVRNHNAFAGKDIWFVGRKQWDKRGAVGTYHYEDIHYASNWDNFLLHKPDGPIVCVDNVQDLRQVSLGSFEMPANSIFVYGEEKVGIPQEIIDSADYILDIPMWGSVRSLNVSVSSGIVMYEYRRQHSL